MAVKPITKEVSGLESDPYVPQLAGVLAPQDEVLAARGGISAIRIYDEIRRDPHAFAVLTKRKAEVVGREWEVFPASDRRLDKRAAEEVERQFKAIDFDRLTRGLMGAVLKGFAVGEVLWANEEGLWVAKAVKIRKQRRFRFNQQSELRLLTRSNMIDGIAVPDRKFIVHRHSIEDDDDDPYGLGIGSVLFWPASFKRQALHIWLRSTERNADPTRVTTYTGGYDAEKQKQALEVIRDLGNARDMVMPDTFQMQILAGKTSSSSAAAHEALNRYLDELMSEAVLGETLTTNSGERGSRSLGEVHNEVRLMIAKADADLLSATLRNTLIRWIVEVNFPGAGIPDVWRDFSESENLDEKIGRDQKLSQMGYRPKSVDYINETYGGEWVDTKETPGPETPADPPPDTEFAEPEPGPADAIIEQLTRELGDAVAPPLADWVDQIRAIVAEAQDYDDLILRLTQLAGEIDVSDVGLVMEAAMTLAELTARDDLNGELNG